MEKLATVRDFMDTHVYTLRPDTEIFDAVDFLLEHRVTGAPVVSADGRLIGILTETDCLKVIAEGAAGQLARGPVSAFMSADLQTVPPEADIYYAAGVFLRHHFRRLPVVEKGKLVGAITRFDILRAVQATRTLARPPKSSGS